MHFKKAILKSPFCCWPQCVNNAFESTHWRTGFILRIKKSVLQFKRRADVLLLLEYILIIYVLHVSEGM